MLPEYVPSIEIIKSSSRLHYRNRIQLHYNLNDSRIGFMGKNGKDILPVPYCKIMHKNVERSYQWLLTNWKNEVQINNFPSKGHVEIYDHDQKINITWNAPYADQGFSQVNQQTNKVMVDTICDFFKSRSKNILDLFGGAGNLTNKLKNEFELSRICVDLYSQKEQEDEFYHLNLFSETALKQFIKEHNNQFDTFFIDPPRSGFKELVNWVDYYKPQYIAYVSCHPATMIRDLKAIIHDYQIKKNYLIDLFPGTYHYETMIFLEKA